MWSGMQKTEGMLHCGHLDQQHGQERVARKQSERRQRSAQVEAAAEVGWRRGQRAAPAVHEHCWDEEQVLSTAPDSSTRGRASGEAVQKRTLQSGNEGPSNQVSHVCASTEK